MALRRAAKGTGNEEAQHIDADDTARRNSHVQELYRTRQLNSHRRETRVPVRCDYTDVNTTPRQDIVGLQVLHDSHVTQHRDGRPLKPDVSSPQLSKFLSLGQTSLVLPLCAFPTDSMRVRVRVRVRVHVHARANLQTWRLQRAAGRCGKQDVAASTGHG